MYSCINYLNRPEVSIITAEDPVEYKKAALREIPDTEAVMLGLDDWPPVIAMWAEHGIPGLCVNPMYSEDPNAYFKG